MRLLPTIRRTLETVAVLGALIWSTASTAQTAHSPLTVGVIPNISARLIVTHYQPLVDFLSRELGRPVEIATAANFRSFAQATRDRQYALIVTAPNLGRVAQVDSRWEPLASYEPMIPALLVAAASNPDSSPLQLRGRGLALANPQSLVALAGLKWLADQNLQQGRDYRIVQVANDDSLGALLVNGEAPLAMMSQGEFRAKPEALRKSLRIVTEMAKLPGFLVMANPDLPAAERRRLRELLLAFPSSEDGRRFISLSGVQNIRAVDDRDLQFLDAFVDVTRASLFPGG